MQLLYKTLTPKSQRSKIIVFQPGRANGLMLTLPSMLMFTGIIALFLQSDFKVNLRGRNSSNWISESQRKAHPFITLMSGNLSVCGNCVSCFPDTVLTGVPDLLSYDSKAYITCLLIEQSVAEVMKWHVQV